MCPGVPNSTPGRAVLRGFSKFLPDSLQGWDRTRLQAPLTHLGRASHRGVWDLHPVQRPRTPTRRPWGGDTMGRASSHGGRWGGGGGLCCPCGQPAGPCPPVLTLPEGREGVPTAWRGKEAGGGAGRRGRRPAEERGQGLEGWTAGLWAHLVPGPHPWLLRSLWLGPINHCNIVIRS